jgi:hypothetical protein
VSREEEVMGYEGWYTIKEAVAFTGLSESTLQRMIKEQKIQREYRPVVGRKDVIVLDPDKIRELKDKPRHPVPSAETTAMVSTPSMHAVKTPPRTMVSPSDMTELMTLLRRPQLRLPEKLLLSTAEAAEFSGLSVNHLQDAARKRLLPYAKGRGYKFRPADLRCYVDTLVDGVKGVNGLAMVSGPDVTVSQ